MRIFIQRTHPGISVGQYQNFSKKKKRNNPFTENDGKATTKKQKTKF